MGGLGWKVLIAFEICFAVVLFVGLIWLGILTGSVLP